MSITLVVVSQLNLFHTDEHLFDAEHQAVKVPPVNNS